jgi:hypothetical protein
VPTYRVECTYGDGRPARPLGDTIFADPVLAANHARSGSLREARGATVLVYRVDARRTVVVFSNGHSSGALSSGPFSRFRPPCGECDACLALSGPCLRHPHGCECPTCLREAEAAWHPLYSRGTPKPADLADEPTPEPSRP